jgi:hypothetical protein
MSLRPAATAVISSGRSVGQSAIGIGHVHVHVHVTKTATADLVQGVEGENG